MNSQRARACPATGRTMVRFASIALTGVLAGTTTAQNEPIFDLRLAGVETITPAEKDRGLHALLPLVNDRLLEAPIELAMASNADPEEAAAVTRAIDIVWQGLVGGSGLMIAPGTGPLGLGLAAWNDPPGDVTADEYAEWFVEALEPAGLTATETDSGLELATPFGPAPITTVNGDTSLLRFGLNDAVPGDVHRYDLPRRATPIFSLHLNLRELTAPLGPILQAQDPMLREQLADVGLVGPDAPLVDAALGHTDDHLHFTMRLKDSRRLMAKSGLDPDVVFTDRDLRAFPRDTTVAFAGPFGLTQFATLRESIAATGQPDPFAMFEEEFGVDLNAGLFENLGPRVMYYQSDSTGGGGWLSSVAIVEVRDAAALEETMGTLVGIANELAGVHANGYVRVVETEFGGHEMTTLMFPGLPVPLQLSWAMREDRLVAGVSPAGLAAALDQLDASRSYLGQNRAFRRAVGDLMPNDGAHAVYFVDTARLAPSGYGLLNMATAALANGVLNPSDLDARSPGTLLPPYGAFVEDIEPLGGVALWEDDDQVYLFRTDRSVAVNAALVASQQGLVGVQAAAYGVGVLIQATGNARESAQQLKASTQVRSIVQAALIWSADNNDRMPDSVGVLVQGGFLADDVLISPFGPAWDGGADYAYAGGSPSDFNARRIIAIDRAMYLNGGQVAVGFADAHVEVMQAWELDGRLDEEVNAGVREKLGID